MSGKLDGKVQVLIQADELDKEVWQAMAKQNDESLGRFVRRACNKEALAMGKRGEK